MQRGEPAWRLTCLACLLDPPVTAYLGWAEGSVVQGMLALVAVTTFFTAAHRTLWIARQLRAPRGPASSSLPLALHPTHAAVRGRR